MVAILRYNIEIRFTEMNRMVRKTGIWLYVETSGWKLFVLMCTGAKKKKKKKKITHNAS